jgi:hypothetical protein
MPPRVLAIGDPSRALTEDNAVAITVGQPSARDPRRSRSGSSAACPRTWSRRAQLPARAARRVTHVCAGCSRLRRAPDRAGVAYDGLPPSIAARPSPRRRRPRRCRRAPPALVSPRRSAPLDIVGLPHATAVKNCTSSAARTCPASAWRAR